MSVLKLIPNYAEIKTVTNEKFTKPGKVITYKLTDKELEEYRSMPVEEFDPKDKPNLSLWYFNYTI
ncbi:hypothetical protein [Desertibacillus haloalkaliphilus]|uniref:hypothetical protein n=1 Tax=Desertibacillus haloalkaliphilus TaxID=1328930 RepID=UPI001C255CDC|nr:hypothetical protein [Desertibacillus haloalkaliphilus]MBU8908112.1 hypothetical protein [Desertibacillus haloalkaliphilus]